MSAPRDPDARDPGPSIEHPTEPPLEPATELPRPALTRRLRWLALAVVAILLAGMAAGYLIQAGLGPIPIGPTSPVASSRPAVGPAGSSVIVAPQAPSGSTSGPTGSAPAPTSVPTAGQSAAPIPSAELQAEVAAVEAQVPPLRQLQPLRAVPTRFLDPAQLRQELEAQLDAPGAAAERTAEQDVLVRLGLASPGLDLRALSLATLTSQVLGFYDPATRSMSIVDRSGQFGLVGRFTVAHEYTHALQDQHFDFARLGVDATFPTDRALALRSLVEGDATLLGGLWMQAHLSLADLPEIGQLLVGALQPPVPQGTPEIVSRELLSPYLDGLTFVSTLYGQGGWNAVDAAYGRPPVSMAEILYPERYLAGWTPAAVNVPALGAALGPGWTQSCLDTMGELTFQVWLAQAPGTPASAAPGAAMPSAPGMPSAPASGGPGTPSAPGMPSAPASGGPGTPASGAPASGAPASAPTQAETLASGWEGDRLASWDGPNGRWALVWRSTWGAPEVAGEVATGARSILDARQTAGPSAGSTAQPARSAVTVVGSTVTILLASDRSTLDRIAGAAGS